MLFCCLRGSLRGGVVGHTHCYGTTWLCVARRHIGGEPPDPEVWVGPAGVSRGINTMGTLRHGCQLWYHCPTCTLNTPSAPWSPWSETSGMLLQGGRPDALSQCGVLHERIGSPPPPPHPSIHRAGSCPWKLRAVWAGHCHVWTLNTALATTVARTLTTTFGLTLATKPLSWPFKEND